MVAENNEFSSHVFFLGGVLLCTPTSQLEFASIPGFDERDAAFMQRLRNLAQEALTWSHLSDQQRLMWATVLELNVVPLQEPHCNLWWYFELWTVERIYCARQVITLKLLGRNVNWKRYSSRHEIPLNSNHCCTSIVSRSCPHGSWSGRTLAEGIQALGVDCCFLWRHSGRIWWWPSIP